jgi:hypothetical protein
MTTQEAYQLVDSAVAALTLSRKDHVTLQHALELLKPKEDEAVVE